MQLSLQNRELLLRLGGEPLAAELDNMVKRITTAYGTEHLAGDTHGNVHALTVSERGRTTPMGVWIPVPWNALNFAGTATTWTVTAAMQKVFSYMLIGTTIFVDWVFENTTIGAACADLFLTIPGGFVAARTWHGPYQASDNGAAAVVGEARVVAGEKIIRFQSSVAGAGWTGSAANNTLRGSGRFEIQ